MMNKKISIKIAVIIGIVELISMTALFCITNYNLTKLLENKAISDIEVIVKDRAQLVETYIKGCCDFIRGYSKAPEVLEALNNDSNPQVLEKLHNLTLKYAADHNEIEGLYTAHWNTYVLDHINPKSIGRTFRNDINSKALENIIKKAGNALCLGVVTAPISKKMVISVYAPVYDGQGNAKGFVGAAFLTGGLSKILNSVSANEIVYSLINAKTSDYIFNNNLELVGEKCSDDRMLDIIKSLRDKNSTTDTISYKSKNAVTTCYFMADRDWVFVVEDANENVFRIISPARKILIVTCLVMTIIMVLTCALNVDYQMKPLREINAKILKLKSSDFTHDGKIEEYCLRHDEFGTIAHAIEELHSVLENQSQLFFEILEAQTVGTLITNAEDNKIILINKMAMKLYGFEGLDKESIRMEDIQALFDEKETEKIHEVRELSKISKEEIVYETTVNRLDGKKLHLLSHAKSARLSNGETIVIFSFINITARKKLEENLLVLSETDSLTSIYNRRSGEYKVKKAVIEGKRGMFCLFDVNKFKHVNDNFGHAAGDQVLVEIAKCMKKSFRTSDILIRLGGDEFVVFAPDIENQQIGTVVLDRLMNNIEKIDIPALKGHKISISLGAVIVTETEEFSHMYTKADSLMYDCKSKGGNAYKFY